MKLKFWSPSETLSRIYINDNDGKSVGYFQKTITNVYSRESKISFGGNVDEALINKMAKIISDQSAGDMVHSFTILMQVANGVNFAENKKEKTKRKVKIETAEKDLEKLF